MLSRTTLFQKHSRNVVAMQASISMLNRRFSSKIFPNAAEVSKVYPLLIALFELRLSANSLRCNAYNE